MDHDTTQLLRRIEAGDREAAGELLPLVYDELRRLAGKRMRQEGPEHTLEATALVHEAYLRLVGDEQQRWNGRAHFFAAAATAMRRILIDGARRKRAGRHGGGLVRQELRDDLLVAPGAASDEDDLLALDEALKQLAGTDPDLAKLVELRFFTGLSIEETASFLGVSASTAKRDWNYARAWLRRAMEGGGRTE